MRTLLLFARDNGTLPSVENEGRCTWNSLGSSKLFRVILNGDRAGPYAFGHSSKSRCMLWCLHANQFYSSSTLSASPDVYPYHVWIVLACTVTTISLRVWLSRRARCR